MEMETSPFSFPMLLAHPNIGQLGDLFNGLKGIANLEWGVISQDEEGQIRQRFPHPHLAFIPACRFEWDARFLPIVAFQQFFLKWPWQPLSPIVATPPIFPKLDMPSNPHRLSEIAFLPQEVQLTSNPISSWEEELRLNLLAYLKA